MLENTAVPSAPTSDEDLIKQAEAVIAQHKKHSAGSNLIQLENLREGRAQDRYVLRAQEYLRRVRLQRARGFNVESRGRVMDRNGFGEPAAPSETPSLVPTAETERATVPQVLDSKNLPAEIKADHLPETNNGLLDYVALFGSTWESIPTTGSEGWRERWALKVLHEAKLSTYNPWVEKWEESDAKSEALAMASADMVVIRVENSDVKDGSLGSMLELSIAIYSAVLRGQRVIVSIEEGIEHSLTDPGARAQLAALKESLEEAIREYPEYITREDNTEKFLALIKKGAEDQRDENKALMPITQEELLAFYSKRLTQISAPRVKVLFGGSGDAFTKDPATRAELERNRTELEAIFGDQTHFESTYLYKGVHKAPWDAAYASGQEEDFREAHRKEKGIKKESGVVINMVTAQARGMGFLNEIGTGLSDALESGQPYALLLEDWDPDLYVRTALVEPKQVEQVTAEMLSLLHEDKALTDADRTEAIAILHALKNNPSELTFSRLKKSAVFKKTTQFRIIDNTRRVRIIAQEQMRNLANSMPMVETPSYELIEAEAPHTFEESTELQHIYELLNEVKRKWGRDADSKAREAETKIQQHASKRRARLEATPVPLFIFETDREKFKVRLQELQQEILRAQAAAELLAA